MVLVKNVLKMKEINQFSLGLGEEGEKSFVIVRHLYAFFDLPLRLYMKSSRYIT